MEQGQFTKLEAKFRAFLQDVSLRSETDSRRRSSDGLYHFTLLSRGDAIQLEEPNCHRYYHRGSNPKPLSLQWGDEALDGAVAEASKMCPGVSEKQLKKALRDLMVKLFNKQVVSEGTADGTASEDVGSEASAELDTILDVLDTSNIGQELQETIQWLRGLAVPQTVYVPIEGLSLSGDVTLGEVGLHNRGTQDELGQVLEGMERLYGKEWASHKRNALEQATCYATVKVTGDGEFARAEATQRVTKALHILNLCLSSSMHQPSWARLRISSGSLGM